MAFALFIPGSIVGFLASLLALFVLQSTLWIAAAVYFAFGFGVPVAVLATSYLNCSSRKAASAQDSTEFHSA
ncbi:hypothetical protein J7413_14315 [Shimia sp. R10_1]|uniref:hypothetical protein n=1 Tax=Shimia sp. R10_1 TaxID=2821095 RepID=UPI001ADC37FA|nr:hypothetical protein [Shimia sp. R10_1]MBO9474720.1 hypothetical protein [Shimia sp. R10_1]